VETEPLELIIVIVMISIALFSVYSYNRSSIETAQSFENRRLLARNIALMIANMWKFQFVNGSWSFSEFNSSVGDLVGYIEEKNGVHVFANISFVYQNGTEINFTLYRSSGAGKENATAFAPAVVGWNISDVPLGVKEYVVPWTNEAYYEKDNNEADVFVPIFFIAQYSNGIPITSKDRIIKLSCTIKYKCKLGILKCTDTKQYDPFAAEPILNGGTVVNESANSPTVSCPSSKCPFYPQLDSVTEVTDIKIYNCSSSLDDCHLIHSFSSFTAEEGIPTFLIENRTESGHVVYLYLLGQKMKISPSSWIITNRKGESLSGSGDIIPIDPLYSYTLSGNAGFFVQGAFNITAGGQTVPFYVLPYMVIFKVKVSW